MLLPIEWEEPFPVVLPESMLCGTPVIAFRRGGVPEGIDHGRTGFLCDDVDEMAAFVGRLGTDRSRGLPGGSRPPLQRRRHRRRVRTAVSGHGRRMRTRTWRAAGIAVVSALAVAAVAASRTDQSFYSDPALQMKTVLQFLAGESSRPNDWTRPDYADLSRSASEDLIVWAPGTPLAFLPFVRAGLTPARAARAVAVLALVAGSAGWVCWFGRFNLPDTILFTFALVLPWMRFSSNALFLYTAEILVFAIVPWILLAALAVERAKRGALAGAAALGLAAGALYIVKYSAVFVTAGVIVWFAWRAWRSLTKKGPYPFFRSRPSKGTAPFFTPWSDRWAS